MTVGVCPVCGMALECVKAWGFQYVTLITWCKDSMGLGQYFRGMTEHCIFATTQKNYLTSWRKESVCRE